MEWYYALNNQQQGPVDEETFQRLVAEGTITPETLVWRAGMPQWKPYRELASETYAQNQPPAAEESAAEESAAHRTYSTTAYDNWSSSQGMPEDNGNRVTISECLEGAASTLKENFGLALGTAVIVFLLLMGSAFILGFIPFLGNIAHMVVAGPIMGGIYGVYLKLVRGQQSGIEDAFNTMGGRFLPLMLFNVVYNVIMMLILIPVMVVFLMPFFKAVYLGQDPAELEAMLQNPDPAMITGLLLMIPLFLLCWYLWIAWSLAMPIIVDYNTGFWSAMVASFKAVNRRLGLFLFLGVVLSIAISIASILTCCLGFLVGLPFLFLCQTQAYDLIFRPRSSLQP